MSNVSALLPDTDWPVARPFWKAANEGRLVVQCCKTCAARYYPPQPACSNCGSLEFSWPEMSGRGRIWSYVIVHKPVLPAFEARVPFAVAVVELEEQRDLRVVAAIQGASSNEQLQIGARVQVVFEELEPGISLPAWRLLRD